MIFVYDRNEKQINAIDEIYELTKEIGKLKTLEFDSELDFEKGYRIIINDNEKPLEFIIIDSEYSRGDIKEYRYYCQESLKEIEGVPIIDKRPQGNVKAAIESLLTDTRWTLRILPTYDLSHTQTNSFYHVSAFEALSKVVQDYNVEWHAEYEMSGADITRRILVIGEQGVRSNSRLEFGKNITKFTRRISSDSIITALYGFGKGEEQEDGGYGRRIDFAEINNGKSYVENLEAKEKYGTGKENEKKHVFGFFVDEEETDKAKLLETTKKELVMLSQPKAEYTVEAVNLNIDCSFGDRVQVIDDEIGFAAEVRIIKEVVQDESKTLTFGTVTKSFGESIRNEFKKTQETINNRITSVREEVLSKITKQYFGEDGYNYDLKAGNEYGLPAGLYSFDRQINQNPSKAIYVGAGKMLISNEKRQNGEWVWKTAATADGLMGDTVVANSITANKLSADVGQALDLTSNASINSKVSSLSEETSTKISQTQDTIIKQVESRSMLVDQIISEIKSSITQTTEGIYFNFERLSKNLDAAIAGSTAEFEKIRKYIRFENGNIVLGAEGNPLTLKIENDKIKFIENGAEIAYWQNRQFYAVDGEFINSLRLGKFAFIPRENGNLSFLKVVN